MKTGRGQYGLTKLPHRTSWRTKTPAAVPSLARGASTAVLTDSLYTKYSGCCWPANSWTRITEEGANIQHHIDWAIKSTSFYILCFKSNFLIAGKFDWNVSVDDSPMPLIYRVTCPQMVMHVQSNGLFLWFRWENPDHLLNILFIQEVSDCFSCGKSGILFHSE